MIIIRELKKEDRTKLLNILNRIKNFSEEEKSVGIELIDSALNEDEQSDYHVKVAAQENNLTGYYCIGPRALTQGVFDLYWIVVDPDIAGEGIGTILLNDAEEYARSKNGRLLLAETSSRKDYDLTRSFYKKNNYKELAVIKDFYKPSDSLIIYGKYLS